MQLKPEDAAKLAGELLDLDTRHGNEPESGLVGVPREDAPSLPGGRVGNYRITRLVGSGGMGEVYEAEQENPRRRVALKVMRAYVLNDELRRRFEHEVRILGSLQHPGIAQIYEAGQVSRTGDIAGDGAGTTPFFAMEYVDGEPLTNYAVGRKLSVRDRLELFLRVCRAVEHAHQRGIIHRDLKPANILVAAPSGAESESGSALTDQLGQPKVLDFGVARATDADVTVTSVHTEVGKLIGTLPYMSPEQASGDPHDLDTRSDVYALGVVLYELLSGKLPYEMKGDAGARVAQALRVIKEVDPTPLSSIDRVFRGDLETIVGKAMEKERDRRYQSVGELAGDIRRYLDDETIEARRASGWYELRKFARRNRALVTSAGALVVILTASTLIAVQGYVTAIEAEHRAQSAEAGERSMRLAAEDGQREARDQANSAQATMDLLKEMIQTAAPEHGGAEVRVIDVLRRLEGHASTATAMQPGVRGNVLESAAQLYLALDEYDQALSLARAAADAFREHEGEGGRRVLACESLQAQILHNAARYKEAAERLAPLLERQVSLFGEADRYSASTATALALAYKNLGKPAEGVAMGRRALRMSELAWGKGHRQTLRAKQNLASILEAAGEYDEAEGLFRETLREQEESIGLRQPERLSTLVNLSRLLGRQMRLDESEKLLLEAIPLSEDLFGAGHPQTLAVNSNYATLLSRKGDIRGAYQRTKPNLEAHLKLFGPKDPRTLSVKASLAYFAERLGQVEEALQLYGEALDGRRGTLGPNHPDALDTQFNLAECLRVAGMKERALPLLHDLVERARALPTEAAWYTAVYSTALGKCEAASGDTESAKRTLSSAYELFRQEGSVSHPLAQSCALALSEIFASSGDEKSAAEWRERSVIAASPPGK